MRDVPPCEYSKGRVQQRPTSSLPPSLPLPPSPSPTPSPTPSLFPSPFRNSLARVLRCEAVWLGLTFRMWCARKRFGVNNASNGGSATSPAAQ